MNNIEEFVDQLLAEKGVQESPEVMAQIKADLVESVEDRVNAMILASLEEEDLSAFEEILSTGTPEQIQAFVKERVSDIDERVAIELLEFKTKYLG